jgi:hypothetical protein
MLETIDPAGVRRVADTLLLRQQPLTREDAIRGLSGQLGPYVQGEGQIVDAVERYFDR